MPRSLPRDSPEHAFGETTLVEMPGYHRPPMHSYLFHIFPNACRGIRLYPWKIGHSFETTYGQIMTEWDSHERPGLEYHQYDGRRRGLQVMIQVDGKRWDREAA